MGTTTSYEHHDLNDPASTQDLDVLERRFQFHFPEEYFDILRASNGVTYWLPSHQKELQFLSTVEVVGYYDAYRFLDWMSEAIPFALDGNSNFLVFDSRHGFDPNFVFLVAAGNLGWEDAVAIAPTFQGLLDDPNKPETIERDSNC